MHDAHTPESASSYEAVLRSLVKRLGLTLFEGWGRPPDPEMATLLRVHREFCKRLLDDTELGMRRLAVVVLTSITEPWALDLLIEALGDGEAEIRGLAVEAAAMWWKHHGGGREFAPASLARVLSLLVDPVEEVRLSAVGPAVQLGGCVAVGRLVQMYGRCDETMQGEIVGALATNGYNAVASRLLGVARAGEPRSAYLTRLARRLGVLEADGETSLAHRPSSSAREAGRTGSAPARPGETRVPGQWRQASPFLTSRTEVRPCRIRGNRGR